MKSSRAPLLREIKSIGLDLDNTLIDYAASYVALAPEFGIDPETATREGVRALLRKSASDDEEWQRFQALLYTEGLKFAQKAAGLEGFLKTCNRIGLEVVIISHKTERGPNRFGSPLLRAPALNWLHEHEITPNWLRLENVIFADDADSKLNFIRERRVDVFVDDLVEILEHSAWPLETLGIQYSSGDWRLIDGRWHADFHTLKSWLSG